MIFNRRRTRRAGWLGLTIAAAAVVATVGSAPTSHAAPDVALDTPSEYIGRAAPLAQREMLDYAVPASVAIAQAALETGWGNSAPGNNHFGIKCANPTSPGSIAIGCAQRDTTECEPDCSPTRAWFRVYASMADSFRDHGLFLRERPRFANCFNFINDPNQFARELQTAGYATDPEYANKLINIMTTHDLYRFNRVVLSGVSSDVTGDGRPDVLARDNAGELWVYPHDGRTGAGNPYLSRYTAGGGWNLATALVTADVTGDGRADVLARDGVGQLWVYPHDGRTGGGNPYTSRYSAGGGWNLATALSTGDVTGDGRPDVLARDGDGVLWIYPHDGRTGGGNPYLSRYTAGGGWNLATALTVADVTGDGRPDVLARDGSGELWVYPHDGRTGTGNPYLSRYTAGGGWNLATALTVGDVTGDGRPDVLARDGNGELWVYPHDGRTGTGNPYLSRYSAGGGWNLATALT